jgi:hypothetical protein
MATLLREVTVVYRGLPYRLNLVACRRALVNCQVEGELDSMERVADSLSISRSTASRFFSGRQTSLAVTLKMLKALHLRFEDVVKPLAGHDDQAAHEGGAAGAGARLRPKPNGGEGAATLQPDRVPIG